MHFIIIESLLCLQDERFQCTIIFLGKHVFSSDNDLQHYTSSSSRLNFNTKWILKLKQCIINVYYLKPSVDLTNLLSLISTAQEKCTNYLILLKNMTAGLI